MVLAGEREAAKTTTVPLEEEGEDMAASAAPVPVLVPALTPAAPINTARDPWSVTWI